MKKLNRPENSKKFTLIDLEYSAPGSSKIRKSCQPVLAFCFLISAVWLLSAHADFWAFEGNVSDNMWSSPGDRHFASSFTTASLLSWVFLPTNQTTGSCVSGTDCCGDIICFGLEYTPGVTGTVTSYTTGFFTSCLTGMTPVVSNASCQLTDNSFQINECMAADSVLFNCSGYDSLNFLFVTSGVPVILHQVCFRVGEGESILISDDPVTDLSLSIDLDGGGFADEFPDYTPTLITKPLPVWPPDADSIVACISSAIVPEVPEVLDFCGNVVPAILQVIQEDPDPVSCQGTRIYTYEYTDCSFNTHTWTYTYFVEYQPFTMPGDGGETVSCADNIEVNLVVPPEVNDHCGIPLVPTGPSAPSYDPPVFGCEGTVTYSWTYMDCASNTLIWDYVFTVEQENPLETGGPVLTDSVILCGLDAQPPLQLPTVIDACGSVIPAPVPTQGGTYNGGCDGTITYSYTYTNCPGVEFVWTFTYTVDCLPLNLKVFLEGPYDISGDSMTPELNLNHVLPGQDKLLSPNLSVQLSAPFTPFGQPYSSGPWNFNENTGMDFGDPTAPGAPLGVIPYPEEVVDWILVTVRENGILPSDNIWTCAGWVHTDGEVTFPESCGILSFDILNEYYILVQHRNHIGILSPSPADMLCGSASLTWDFTALDSYAPIFRVGQQEVVPGIWAMIAANGEQELFIGAITSNDRTTWRILQNALGYSVGDYNMDVSTNSADETNWKLNQNKTSGIIFY